MKLVATFIILALGFLTIGCHGFTCEQESIFGVTTVLECPGIFDNPSDKFCCGPKENRRCCEIPFNIDKEDFEKIVEGLPSILAIIFGIIISSIVLCIVCCCCCPFCFCYKRRQRGIVHNPAPAPNQMQAVMTTAPGQQNYVPVQSGPPPPQAYPQQGYAPQPYMPQSQGYAPQGGAPYPTAMPTGYPPQPGTHENPPPYNEKQMPFNPNY